MTGERQPFIEHLLGRIAHWEPTMGRALWVKPFTGMNA